MRWIVLPGNPLAAEDAEAQSLDDLAARTAGGDQAAFSEIYSLLVDGLYGYARGQCADATAAEDVVANVFLRAWRSARTYRSSSRAYRRWIYTIARNEVRSYWRRAQRERLSLSTLQMDIAAPEVERKEAPEDLLRMIGPALAALTDIQREVVVLRYLANESYEDIARITGRREGAVRALVMRALRRMRRELEHAAQ
jgi:RNA polymerase sigma-70 factor (ECF subfamily)